MSLELGHEGVLGAPARRGGWAASLALLVGQVVLCAAVAAGVAWAVVSAQSATILSAAVSAAESVPAAPPTAPPTAPALDDGVLCFTAEQCQRCRSGFSRWPQVGGFRACGDPNTYTTNIIYRPHNRTSLLAAAASVCSGEFDFSWRWGAQSEYGAIERWNVSLVTDMSFLFRGCAKNVPGIGSWDMSRVTLLDGMFLYARAFDEPLGNWNTANVQSMISMFEGASAFGQFLCWPHSATFPAQDSMWSGSKIGGWGSGTQKDCKAPPTPAPTTPQPTQPTPQPTPPPSFLAFDSKEFLRLAVVNQCGPYQLVSPSLGREYGWMRDWDVSRITDFSYLFSGIECNTDISKWSVANAVNMSHMFFNASTFNINVGSWSTAKVLDMTGMFKNASAFNQKLCWPHDGTMPAEAGMWAFSKVGGWGTKGTGLAPSCY
jgi:hypothetical protein